VFERRINLPGGEVGQMLLTGEGGHKGLVAVLKGTPAQDGEVYREGLCLRGAVSDARTCWDHVGRAIRSTLRLPAAQRA
jgi:hypothetical protein